MRRRYLVACRDSESPSSRDYQLAFSDSHVYGTALWLQVQSSAPMKFTKPSWVMHKGEYQNITRLISSKHLLSQIVPKLTMTRSVFPYSPSMFIPMVHA